jgi:DNA invertase Pin-like site-specific DNA recombinase
LNIFASLAEFERDIIRERTRQGCQLPERGDAWVGKKKGLSPEAIKKAETAVMLYKEKKTAEEIASIIGVGRSTVYRYLEARGQKRVLAGQAPPLFPRSGKSNARWFKFLFYFWPRHGGPIR